jgi:hypothetical protein
MQKPKVLVGIENGAASISTMGDVEVLVVDYDVLRMGESLQIPESFYNAFAGLREAVSARVDDGELRTKNGETSANQK